MLYLEAKGGKDGRTAAEQIIGKLRGAELLQGKGLSMEEILRQLGIHDATYDKWHKEYGRLRVDQAKRLKELEDEITQLRKVVSDLSIDIAILKEGGLGETSLMSKGKLLHGARHCFGTWLVPAGASIYAIHVTVPSSLPD